MKLHGQFIDSTIEEVFNSAIVYAGLMGYEVGTELSHWGENDTKQYIYFQKNKEGYVLQFNIADEEIKYICVGRIGARVSPVKYSGVVAQKNAIKTIVDSIEEN